MFVGAHLAKWKMGKRFRKSRRTLVEELKSSCFSLFVLTAQSHLLRKVVDPTTGRLYLGLFLYLADNTQVIENSHYMYICVTTVYYVFSITSEDADCQL